ncbi:MAG: aldehyde dehydrogenase family protein [Candidatus Thermoplasmatota archaeon]
MIEAHPILVGGEWVQTSSGLEVRSPYDGAVVGTTYLADAQTLEQALSASLDGFKEMGALPAYRRAAICHAISQGIKKRREEFARLIVHEAGKPIRYARAEVERAATTFLIAAEEAGRIEGELLALDGEEAGVGRTGIVRRFPVGPIAAIAPFNFPLNLVAHKLAPAIASGNPAILKPASKTPLTALLLGQTVLDAGLPPHELSVLPMDHALAAQMIADPRIKMLSFTGSADVGWGLRDSAGRKKVVLELGGNAGVIVCEDADLSLAVERCTYGAFAYSGQVCISVQRIFAHHKCYDELKERMVAAASRLRIGDPMLDETDIGPMIDHGNAERVEDWVSEAVAHGAELLVGGLRDGIFYPPTLLEGVSRDMKLWRREVFGPVATLEPYADFQEALEAVNDSEFGLQAGVFTKDMGRALTAFEKLEVGGVIVNDVPTFRVEGMPYGGVKRSGMGREGVRYAIEEMTERRLLVLRA